LRDNDVPAGGGACGVAVSAVVVVLLLSGCGGGEVAFGVPTVTPSAGQRPTSSSAPVPFDANGVRMGRPRAEVAADGSVTLHGRVEVTRRTRFRELQIAVRGEGDSRRDANPLDVAIHEGGVTVPVDLSFEDTQTYAPGTYLANVAYMLADGTWHNGPRVSFTVS
jgi:hypothetical protein